MRACVHAFGLDGVDAEKRLAPMEAAKATVAVSTSDSIVTARIEVSGPHEEARREVQETVSQIMRRWHPYCFGRDGESLGSAVGGLLVDTGRSLATAESCTGGLLGAMIVDVAGCSRYYLGGWVTYTDDLKRCCLGVPESALEDGSVSEPAAGAMATGALVRSRADLALAVTGIAGPEGGSKRKPAGTVYVALARRTGGAARAVARRFLFPGDRSTVRDRAAKSALQVLRFALLDLPQQPLQWQHETEGASRPDG